jgi:hypothetical protein
MKPIIQTSCSELLVDTRVYDPEVAFEQISELFKEHGFSSEPQLSVELLKDMKRAAEEDASSRDQDMEDYTDETIRVFIYDSYGNRCALEYGDNGYGMKGYRFDSQNNDGDEKCYPIFSSVLSSIKTSTLIAEDGGHIEGYREWEKEHKC